MKLYRGFPILPACPSLERYGAKVCPNVHSFHAIVLLDTILATFVTVLGIVVTLTIAPTGVLFWFDTAFKLEIWRVCGVQSAFM